jgi:hypothetical protein
LDTDLSRHVHIQLRHYLQGSSSLEDLEHWLIFNAWDTHQTGDERATQLVAGIQDAIVAHNNGILTEADVRKELFNALRRDLAATTRP